MLSESLNKKVFHHVTRSTKWKKRSGRRPLSEANKLSSSTTTTTTTAGPATRSCQASAFGRGGKWEPERKVRSHFEYYEDTEELVCNPSSSPYNMQAKVVASLISDHGLKMQRHDANMFTGSLIMVASLAACFKLLVKHWVKHYSSSLYLPGRATSFPTISLASVGFVSIWFARLDVLCYLASVLAGWWSMTLAMDEAGRKKSHKQMSLRNLRLKREQERGRYAKIILRDSIAETYHHPHQKKQSQKTHKEDLSLARSEPHPHANGNGNVNGHNYHTPHQHQHQHQHHGRYDVDVLSGGQQQHLQRQYDRFLKVSKSSYVISPHGESVE